MKKGFSAVVVILMILLSTAEAENKELGVTFDLTYMSKWMSKGAEAYGQQGAFFKTIDIDFYGTGFGVAVTHRNATGSGYVDKQRFDYRPYYKGKFFEDKTYATNYNISCGYEHYPGLARNVSNTTFEWIFAFFWPGILAEGFTPRYTAHYEYPAGSHYNHSNITGWVHRFGLDYDVPAARLTMPLRLSSEIAYTDGLGGAEHDWSYAMLGVSTKFTISENVSFIPGLYHQLSMDDSVAKQDVTYCKLTMKYKF